MDNMRLDPASSEPARQPEAVAASLIGQRDPTDRPASTPRFVPPPLDQSQQCRRIRLQFLQRLALDARNNSAHQPARLAHLDHLRCRLPGFVRRLHSYYGGVRLLTIVHHRLRLLAFPTRTSAARMLALADHEISRFPSKERPHMPVSTTTPDRLGARTIAPIRVAFRQRNDVATRNEGTFAAQWLAYALPCQPFPDALASISPYLGVYPLPSSF